MTRARLTSRKIYAYLSASWTDISADVLAPSNQTASWGMPGNGPLDRLAGTGSLGFTLQNATGKYTPGNPTALTDWGAGTIIKIVLSFGGVDYIRFYGKIPPKGIRIYAKPADNAATVAVTVLDWMDYAANHPMVSPTYQTNIQADDALNTVVLGMPIQPLFNAYEEGIYVFPATGDSATVRTKAYTEFAKIVYSEMSYLYLKKDYDNGERLYFENNHARHGWRALATVNSGATDIVLENAMIMSADIRHGESLENRALVKVYPKRIDTSLSVLFSLSSPMLIGPGETKTFRGGYTDPVGGAQVNAISGTMVAPVATTDYQMFENSDGTGTDMTADLTVTPTYGSEGVTYELTKNAATKGYVTFLQARGYGIYQYNVIEASDESADSQDIYGYQNLSFDQQYQREISPGRLEVMKIVELEKNPRTSLYSITAEANHSSDMMLFFLNADIGSLVQIIIDQAGIDGRFYIQNISFTHMPGGIVMFTWIVRQAFSLLAGLSLLGVQFAEANTTDMISFSYLPHISNLTTRTDSVWFYVTSWPVADQSIAQIGSSFFLGLNSTNHSVVYKWAQATTDGEWETPVNSISLNTWYHVLATRDVGTVTNDPIIYINGSAQTLTEVSTPAGAVDDQTGMPLTIGNVAGNATPFDGVITDYRIYLPIVSAGNAAVICGEGPGGTGVTTGMAFQVPTVRTKELTLYEGQTLTGEKKLLDNVYGMVGTATGAPVAENLQVVLGNVESQGISSGLTKTWSHRIKPGNNRLLAVAVIMLKDDNWEDLYLTKDGPGSNFSRAQQLFENDSPTGTKIELLYYPISPTPVGNVEIYIKLANTIANNGSTQFAVVSMDFSNVDQTAPFMPFGSEYEAQGNSATASVTVVDSAFGDMVIDLVAALAPLTVGSKQTECLNQVFSGSIRGGVSLERGMGANTVMSWGLASSAPWSIGAIAVKVAP